MTEAIQGCKDPENQVSSYVQLLQTVQCMHCKTVFFYFEL